MAIKSSAWAAAGAALCATALATHAGAADASGETAGGAPAEAAVAEPQPASLDALLQAESASDAELASCSGGATLIVQQATLGSSVSGNSVGDGATTGQIRVSDSALSDVRGVFAGTFNTGNNVSIQTNVDVVVVLE